MTYGETNKQMLEESYKMKMYEKDKRDHKKGNINAGAVILFLILLGAVVYSGIKLLHFIIYKEPIL